MLERKELEIVEAELKNIEDLETKEQLRELIPENFTFNVASEQVEFPTSLDWSSLVSDRTATEVSSSS